MAERRRRARPGAAVATPTLAMLRADCASLSAALIKAFFEPAEPVQLDALVHRLAGALLAAATPEEARVLARTCCRANKRRTRKLAEALGALALSGEPFSYAAVRLAALLSMDVEFGAALATPARIDGAGGGLAAALVAMLPVLDLPSPMTFAVLDLLCAITASGSPATVGVVTTPHSTRSLVRLALKIERAVAATAVPRGLAGGDGEDGAGGGEWSEGAPRRPTTLGELAELRCGVLKLLHRGAMGGCRAVIQAVETEADITAGSLLDCDPWQECHFQYLPQGSASAAVEDDDVDLVAAGRRFAAGGDHALALLRAARVRSQHRAGPPARTAPPSAAPPRSLSTAKREQRQKQKSSRRVSQGGVASMALGT